MRGPRDDLQRLMNYARGLGVKVRTKPCEYDGPGAYYIHEPPTIVLSEYSGQSITRKVLNLLHELGHHLDWIYKNKRVAKADEKALIADNDRLPGQPPLSQRLRQRIFRLEWDGTAYMPQIAKECDLSIPMWKVEADMKTDRWVARVFLDTGEWPTHKATKQALRQFRQETKGE